MNKFVNVAAELVGVGTAATELVSNGVNKNVRVNTESGDIFIRFSPESLHTRQDLISEADFLIECRRMGLPVCTLVSIRDMFVSEAVTITGQRYHLLASQSIEGDSSKPYPSECRSFGVSLAKVHAFSGRTQNLPGTVNGPRSSGALSETSQRLWKAVIDLPQGKSESGPCHGDAWLGNGIRTSSEVILFDFEFLHLGPQVYDIATFLWGLSPATSAQAYDLFQAFIDGYASIRHPAYDLASLKRELLRKELHSVNFLNDHIQMSESVIAITRDSADQMLAFAHSEDFSRYEQRL